MRKKFLRGLKTPFKFLPYIKSSYRDQIISHQDILNLYPALMGGGKDPLPLIPT